MAEVNDLELIITVFFGVVAGMGLLWAGVFPDGSTAVVFTSMVLIGFIAVRTIRGRKWSWR